ncbi:hypothetical protein BDP67DRAFT_563446 [Colletotrichum lupini]|nr:hypothetical protein BDP67DRAFT_563446 [Colletotrichum lupini]
MSLLVRNQSTQVLKSAELNQCARLTFSRQENGASGCAIERSMSPPIGQLQLPNMDTLYASPSCAIPLPIATLPAATGISGIKREILGVKTASSSLILPDFVDMVELNSPTNGPLAFPCLRQTTRLLHHIPTDTASGVYSSRSTVLRPMCTTMNQSNAPCLSSKQLIASVRTSVGRKTHTSTQFITQTGQSTSSSRGDETGHWQDCLEADHCSRKLNGAAAWLAVLWYLSTTNCRYSATKCGCGRHTTAGLGYIRIVLISGSGSGSDGEVNEVVVIGNRLVRAVPHCMAPVLGIDQVVDPCETQLRGIVKVNGSTARSSR